MRNMSISSVTFYHEIYFDDLVNIVPHIKL